MAFPNISSAARAQMSVSVPSKHGRSSQNNVPSDPSRVFYPCPNVVLPDGRPAVQMTPDFYGNLMSGLSATETSIPLAVRKDLRVLAQLPLQYGAPISKLDVANSVWMSAVEGLFMSASIFMSGLVTISREIQEIPERLKGMFTSQADGTFAPLHILDIKVARSNGSNLISKDKIEMPVGDEAKVFMGLWGLVQAIANVNCPEICLYRTTQQYENIKIPPLSVISAMMTSEIDWSPALLLDSTAADHTHGFKYDALDLIEMQLHKRRIMEFDFRRSLEFDGAITRSMAIYLAHELVHAGSIAHANKDKLISQSIFFKSIYDVIPEIREYLLLQTVVHNLADGAVARGEFERVAESFVQFIHVFYPDRLRAVESRYRELQASFA